MLALEEAWLNPACAGRLERAALVGVPPLK